VTEIESDFPWWDSAIVDVSLYDRFAPIVLKNSFSPMIENSQSRWRASLASMRGDHINHRKNARWRSYRFYRALQWLNTSTCDICEIIEAPRFSSFTTQSATSGHSITTHSARAPPVTTTVLPSSLNLSIAVMIFSNKVVARMSGDHGHLRYLPTSRKL
jgi:hypothetical protein